MIITQPKFSTTYALSVSGKLSMKIKTLGDRIIIKIIMINIVTSLRILFELQANFAKGQNLVIYTNIIEEQTIILEHYTTGYPQKNTSMQAYNAFLRMFHALQKIRTSGQVNDSSTLIDLYHSPKVQSNSLRHGCSVVSPCSLSQSSIALACLRASLLGSIHFGHKQQQHLHLDFIFLPPFISYHLCLQFFACCSRVGFLCDFFVSN